MQYKIPVQIENADPIFLGLSLKQLIIMMIGGSIAYSLFTSLAPDLGPEIALIPSGLIAALTFMIAVFKHSEMTFIPFVLSLLQFHTNAKERSWVKGVDSFQPIDIGYVSNIQKKQTNNIDMTSKIDKIKELENNIDKI